MFQSEKIYLELNAHCKTRITLSSPLEMLGFLTKNAKQIKAIHRIFLKLHNFKNFYLTTFSSFGAI